MHPNLNNQLVMEGGEPATAAIAPRDSVGSEYMTTGTDKGIPGCLALIAVGCVGGLLVLRLAGFRFSFGVNVGGGS